MKRPEDILQAEIVAWYSMHYGRTADKLLFHVNNKAKNKIEGNRMKAMGVKTGVSDLILVHGGRVIFVELKAGSPQSKEQKEFQRQVEAEGQVYVIVRSLEEFINKVCRIEK